MPAAAALDGANPRGVDCGRGRVVGCGRATCDLRVGCRPVRRRPSARRGRMSESQATASIEVALAHATRLLSTDPALAAEQAREILRVAGEHPPAALVLGAAHRARGAAAEAVEVLAPLARVHPEWALLQFELGMALSGAGRGDEAVAALRRALALKPGLPQAWLALAGHLDAAGDGAGAEAARAE